MIGKAPDQSQSTVSQANQDPAALPLESNDATSLISTEQYKRQVEEAIKELEVIVRYYRGNIRAVALVEFKNKYPKNILSSPEVQSLAQQGMIQCLSDGDISTAIQIKDTFSLPEPSISSPEVKSAAQQGMIQCLSDGDISTAIQIKDTFSPPEQLWRNAVESFCKESGLAISFEQVTDILKQDRFGSNLIGKFACFDTVAKDAVNQVLMMDAATDSSIDRRSLAYRNIAQSSLMSFGENEHIIQTLHQEGVEVTTWLSYDKVSLFELGDAQELSLGEKIADPVNRLPAALSAYVQAIKEALQEYKGELMDKELIDEGGTILSEKIATMKALILSTEEPVKKEGLRRGLRSLEAKLQNPKKIRVWDKLTSEISKLHKLSLEIQATNALLIQEESTKIEVIDDASLALAMKKKEKVWSFKTKVKKELESLERRVRDIFGVYQETLTPVIGRDRAEAVVQQAQREVEEHADHIRTDMETVSLFLGDMSEVHDQVDGQEVSDDDEYQPSKDKIASLSGRQMSIRVGGRSRQDLYLGNYTTCCIRIDSEYHGSESPIADYVTDLGMQNVILYDEVLKQPVACAWCWIGIDPSIGETALVVDNIEGWQLYTVNFRKQLNEKMREFLEGYAQSINVGTLSQGPDYNDLDVVPKEEQTERFVKLGGCNRADGYYLEAES